MPYRIDEVRDREEWLLRVAGDLDARAAAKLGRLLQSAARSDRAPVIDLAQVRFADRSGARFLNEAQRRGVELRCRSPFLRQLMAALSRSGEADPGPLSVPGESV